MDRTEWAWRERGPEEIGGFAVDIDAVHIPTLRHVTFRITLAAVHPDAGPRPWDDVLWDALVAHAGEVAD